jgi:hypothetical protein
MFVYCRERSVQGVYLLGCNLSSVEKHPTIRGNMSSPKRLLTLRGLHGLTSQKIELFITTVLRSSYPTQRPTVVRFIQLDSQNTIPCTATHLSVSSHGKTYQNELRVVSVFPGAPTSEHKASVKRFLSLKFLNPKTVGRTPWTRDQPVARPLPTQDNTNTE